MIPVNSVWLMLAATIAGVCGTLHIEASARIIHPVPAWLITGRIVPEAACVAGLMNRSTGDGRLRARIHGREWMLE